jgi:hypothetical protein
MELRVRDAAIFAKVNCDLGVALDSGDRMDGNRPLH